ncbi:MAG: alginate O-acetyltransferase AlgF [Spirochaetia bacterium]
MRRVYFAERRKSGGRSLRPEQFSGMRVAGSRVAVLVCGLLFGLILAPAASFAQNGSLYGEGAPEDAGYVRVFNNRSGGAVSSLWVGATEFQNLPKGESSAYRPVTPEIHMVYLNDAFEELIAREGAYYTIVLQDDGLSVHVDPTHRRADLAQILVYNLDVAGTVALKSADGATTVVDGVMSGEAGAVAVNPVAVELAVFVGDQMQAVLGDIGLERGQSYAVFVSAAEGRPAVRVDRAVIQAE